MLGYCSNERKTIFMKFFSLLATPLFALSMASEIFAQAAAAAPAKTPNLMEMLVMPVGFLAIMYFLVIRPQQKRSKDQQILLTSLKPGDEVVTQAGLIGRIKSFQDHVVSLEVAHNTVIKILKSSITGPALKPELPVKK